MMRRFEGMEERCNDPGMAMVMAESVVRMDLEVRRWMERGKKDD